MYDDDDEFASTYLKIASFPNCCGIHIIHGFGNTATAESAEKKTLTEKEADNDLKTFIKKTSVGVFMIVLNNDQRPKFHDLLVKHAFQPLIDSAYHPGHGNTLTLYARANFGTGMKPDLKPKKTKDSLFQKCTY